LINALSESQENVSWVKVSRLSCDTHVLVNIIFHKKLLLFYEGYYEWI
jgi:hypothetical protein